MLKNKKEKTRITEKGITLVALVVTIVVLIILATISISIIFSEDGIMEKARQTKEYQANADAQWSETNANVISYIDDAIGGKNTPTTPQQPTYPVGPTGKQLVTSVTTTNHGTINAEDRLGNPITVPGGFA